MKYSYRYRYFDCMAFKELAILDATLISDNGSIFAKIQE